MTSDGKSTEWLDLMLGDLEQRRRERREAEEEAARRSTKGDVRTSGSDRSSDHGAEGDAAVQTAERQPVQPQGK